MSLRTRLFIIISGLVILLLAAQWLLFRMLTDDLEREAGVIAFTVGKDLTRVFSAANTFEVDVDTENSHMIKEEIIAAPEESTNADGAPSQNAAHVFVKRVTRTENGETTVKTTERKLVGRPVLELDWQPETAPGQFSHDFRYKIDMSDSDTAFGDEVIHMTLDDPADAKHLVLKGSTTIERIPIPTTGIDRSLEQMIQRLFIGSALLLLLGLISAAMVAQHLTAPLRSLAGAAQTLGSGKLGVQADNTNPNSELGRTISEFNSMSARLKQLDEEAKRSQQMAHFSELGEIARGLAHTIRNPLNTLGLSMEQMAALNSDREESADLADIARQQIRRIDQWIRSFLALAGREAASVEDLDLAALVQDIALEALQIGGAAVELHIDDDSLVFRGVSPELRAVFQALIVNAVEASDPDDPVTVTLSGNEKHIELIVEDQGPGLAQEVLGKLFTPHVTTKENGSGMGLFLAHRMVHSRYRGQIEITNRQPGARAHVLLPRNWETQDA